jgi:hypothetical protein
MAIIGLLLWMLIVLAVAAGSAMALAVAAAILIFVGETIAAAAHEIRRVVRGR